MKATGIVRRIDDLGRIVIPKEIRRTMHIREGDPLEIYTDREGEVIFKKYSPIGELTEFAARYAETLHKTCGLAVAICDRDAVVACSGIPRKEYTDRPLSSELEEAMERRALYTSQSGDPVPLTDGGSYSVNCMMPIITEGDITGCVASLVPKDGERQAVGEMETKLIQTAAGFLGIQLEN